MAKIRSLTRHIAEFLFGSGIDLDGLDERDLRWIRAAQIDAVVQLVPLTMTINVMNAAIVVFVFWKTGSAAFLIAWSVTLALVAAASVLSWRRSRRKRPKKASARAIRRMILHATVLGALWGIAPLVLFPGAGLMEQLILACLVAGMISGGAFGLSTVPAAGLAYTWTIVIASMGALFLAGEQTFAFTAVLLLLYTLFISRNLVAHGTLFADHLRDRLRLKSQSEVIGLLLKDFQEHASDWLWETDASGALVRVSDRFANAAGKTPEEMEGAPFCHVIDCNRDQQTPEIEDIIDHMTAQSAFRDLLVPIRAGAHWRFWSLSAKPVYDATGEFTGYRGVGADVTEKRLADDRISYLARYDIVTGLPNRASFREAVDRTLADVRENEASAAVLFIDLDQFKAINDTLGHDVGDALLKGVGERINDCARKEDVVARLGGDEFAIVQSLPNEPTATLALARRLMDAFKEPLTLDQGDIVIGASVGIAFAPADGQDADVLMRNADLALYGAKADGAGTYCFFEPEMEAVAHRRRDLEVGLRAAVENDELDLAFQPIVDLDTGRVTCCEALVRWRSPEWGEVSPAEFIPVAESTGLIAAIGEWVLREAVKTARNWPDGTTVAVNLSPVQFRQQKLLANVVDALVNSGLPPQRLELEVTESIFLDGSEQTLEMLNHLRTLGVRIALDDFGTGYSSLSYLRRFPFDRIKIDKSFIDHIATQGESVAIIRSIVALANGLGMTTTAEGVETEAQIEQLRELGCTRIQGYVFSPPLPASGIAELAAKPMVLPTAGGSVTAIADRARAV